MSSYSKKEKEGIVKELREVLDDYENLARALEAQIEQNTRIKGILGNLLTSESDKTEEGEESNESSLSLQKFLFELDSQDAFDRLSLSEVNQLLPISVAWLESDSKEDWELKARGCAFLMAAMAKWRKELFEVNTENSDLFKRLGTAFADKEKFTQLVTDKVISESELEYCVRYFRKDECLNDFTL